MNSIHVHLLFPVTAHSIILLPSWPSNQLNLQAVLCRPVFTVVYRVSGSSQKSFVRTDLSVVGYAARSSWHSRSWRTLSSSNVEINEAEANSYVFMNLFALTSWCVKHCSTARTIYSRGRILGTHCMRGWRAIESIWTQQETEIFLHLQGNESRCFNVPSLFLSLILTELSRPTYCKEYQT
jgi:hypothetical protein